MSEIIKIGRKSQLVIPKAVRERVGVGEGDRVFVSVVGEAIVIVPLPRTVKELSGMGRGLYSRDHVSSLRDEWE